VAVNVGGYLVARYQAWGFAMFAFLLLGLFKSPLGRLFSRLRDACRGMAETLRLLKKIAKTVLVLGTLATVLYFLPMELKVAGEFSILPIRNADVRAEVEGFIQAIPHDEGDVVHKGEVLARLNDRDTRAELRKIAAEIEETQAKLKMLKAGPRREEVEVAKTDVTKAEERLNHARRRFEIDSASFKQGFLSRREYESAAGDFAVWQKELDGARDRLNLLLAGSRPEEIEGLEAELNRLNAQQRYLQDQFKLLTVTSPVTGVIATHRLKEELGQHVEKGDFIAKVDELNIVTAEIAISEKDISDVKVGQKVLLKARAYPLASFEGTVTSIAPITTPPGNGQLQRTVVVETRLDNKSLLLRPGMSGQAKIRCGEERALELVGRRFVRYLRVEFWSWW